MEHDFYFDGNTKRISWSIKTKGSVVNQFRDHVESYLDKISVEQSKYIALHVGIFWAIGTFTIRNEDTVNIMIDSKDMYEHLRDNIQKNDKLITDRRRFIFQLISQRKLKVRFVHVVNDANIASCML